MRAPLTAARALYLGTVIAGGATVAASAFMTRDAALATVALLAAAVLATELIEVPSDPASFDPGDAHVFTFSSAVHLAAVMLVGPWAAALIAAFGVVVVDGLRGTRWRYVSYNGAVFALAAAAGGAAFTAFGATPGTLDLPSNLAAVGALAVVYSLVNAVLVNAIVALESRRRLWPELSAAVRAEVSSRAPECGLGLSLALLAIHQPWGLIALVPLMTAVYRAHAGLATLRRETAHTLETFANIVDERDPYTYRHSARVADHVEGLAKALGIASPAVARLRWAGRLHDLGKIAVDPGVLRQPGQLGASEWASMRRHPRLSARLLRRLRLATDEARAVEYHHERYDGRGYYGIQPSALPLAAHFLTVADSYDAMTSDRPYRRGMTKDQALAEVERAAGTQFHPAVARAFVAYQRGIDPRDALGEAERHELRRLTHRRPRLSVRSDRVPEALALVGVVAALGAVAAGSSVAGAAAVVVAGLGVTWRLAERRVAARIAHALRAAAASTDVAGDVAEVLRGRLDVRWIGVLSWRDKELNGEVVAEWGDQDARPTETALISWLIRETENTGPLHAAGDDVGRSGSIAALPIGAPSERTGFVILAFRGRIKGEVLRALDALGGGLPAAVASRTPTLALARRAASG